MLTSSGGTQHAGVPPAPLLPNMALFLGPAGGVFKLELFLPEDYPMAAPKVMWRRHAWRALGLGIAADG